MAEFLLLRDLPRYECMQRRAQRYRSLDITAVETTLSLLRVSSDMMEAFTAHFERNDITQSRFIVLMLVEQYDSVGEAILPSAIADKLSVTRATVTGLLDGLERDGLIERRQHGDDRRALTLHLTKQGWSYLEGMLPDHYRRVAGMMGHLSHDEQRQLVGLLSKVNNGLDALRHADWQSQSVTEAMVNEGMVADESSTLEETAVNDEGALSEAKGNETKAGVGLSGGTW